MKPPLNKLFIRVIVEFAVSAVVFSVIWLAIYNKFDISLINSITKAVSMQTQSVAYTLGERFQHKLDELQTRANLLEQHKISVRSIMDVDTFGTKEGRTRGILRGDNSVIIGEPLREEFFDTVRKAVAGRQAMDYLKDVGLLFAVPVSIDGEPCVFYELFNDEAVKTFYKTISYNGNDTLMLGTSYDNRLVLSEGKYPELAAGEYPIPNYMGLDTSKITNFDATIEQLKNAAVTPEQATMFFAENEVDAFFFYCTYVVPEDKVALYGYVEWDDVVVGVNYIYTLMKFIYGIVLVLLFLFACYTMRIRQAHALEHEKVIADSANHAKSNFLANMSHEIRTPINAIMGMDEMILRESKEPLTIEYANNINHAAKNLLGIINDVLDFSKIEAGKMEIIPVNYEVGTLLSDLVNIIRKRATDKGLAFNINVNPDIPNELFGDEVRLRQIVTNILTNAVKYTKSGSVTLTINYTPIDKDNIYLHFRVRDTGIGIKKNDIKKLFCAFTRLEEERNRTIEGTGLGMNITRQLLRMLGSKLKVRSIYGKGSVFGFTVAQRVINSAPVGDFEETYKHAVSQKHEYKEAFVAPDAKVLVVDDTAMNLTVFKGLLKQTKIQIDTANGGKECLELVRKKHYDIIFLDHMMPEMDGFETLAAINDLPRDQNPNRDTPIISLTANAVRGSREKYLAAGFKDYLTKPIICANLEKLIIKYLPHGKVLLKDATSAEEAREKAPDEGQIPAWLKKVELLNVAEGVSHCGSVAAYLEALCVFAEAIPVVAKETENYFAAKDWQSYTIKVHALKSTARIIGAADLSARAKRLEEAGNSGAEETILREHRSFMEQYLAYGKALKPLLPEEKTAAKPLIERAAMQDAYATMNELAAAFDYDSLAFVIDSLDEYTLPEEDAERLQKIKNAAAKPDWDALKILLAEIAAAKAK